MRFIAGLPSDQPEQPDRVQDTAATQEEVTGALATPRDAAEETKAERNPSLIVPLRYGTRSSLGLHAPCTRHDVGGSFRHQLPHVPHVLVQWVLVR